MAEWLHPVFSRTKTSILGGSTTPLLDRLSAPLMESPRIEVDESRRRITRVPSNLNFRTASPPIITPIFENFPKIREPGVIYHSPSRDQIAESLKVVMMTRSNLEPLPREYNSSILHLLEAYHDLTVELKVKNDQIEELVEQHRTDIKEFEDLADKWTRKENEYKLEVKRLELMLVNTDGGLEGLTLARMGSVVYGSGRVREVIDRAISGFKERKSQRDMKDEDKEVLVRRQATAKLAVGRRRLSSSQSSGVSGEDPGRICRPTSRHSYKTYKQAFSETSASSAIRPGDTRLAPELPRAHHEESRLHRAQQSSFQDAVHEKEDCPISPASNKQSDPSRTDIYSPYEASTSFSHGLGIELEKEISGLPFGPQIPGPTAELLYIPEVTDAVNSELLTATATEKKKGVSAPLGFSFREGDDVELLARGGTVHKTTKLVTGEPHLRNRTSQDSIMNRVRTPPVVRVSKSTAKSATDVPTPSARRNSRSSYSTPTSKPQSTQPNRQFQRPTSPAPTPSLIAARRGSRNLEIEVPKRLNSSSSVVTAVRPDSLASCTSSKSSVYRGNGIGKLDGGRGRRWRGFEELREGFRVGTVGGGSGGVGTLAVVAAEKAVEGKRGKGGK